MTSASKKSKLEETEENRKTGNSKEYEKECHFERKCSLGVHVSDYKLHCMACNIDLRHAAFLQKNKKNKRNMAMFILQYISFFNLSDHVSQYIRQKFKAT